MNRNELAYSEYLEQEKAAGKIIGWWFERVKLKVGESCYYSPDFMVLEANGEVRFDEVKPRTKNKNTGKETYWAEEDSVIKVKSASQQFPFAFRIVWKSKEHDGWGMRELD